MKQQFEMTLVDVSPEMLAVSRKLNPDCEHVEGDMRTIRLGREFDRVFIHDAICYMTSIPDLRQAADTAFVHCRPGGAALFAPDFVRESFRACTDHGGNDGEARSVRYLEWTWDPDPSDCCYTADYVYMLRSEDGSLQIEHDRHVEGLFARAEWLQVLRDAGFEPHAVAVEFPGGNPEKCELFAGVKPAGRART